MGFLAPLALSLAALSVPILLLYVLKLRHQEQVVSSTMLWQQVLRDRQANAPWQRLRRNVLLLLQLLALFLSVFALARPYSEIAHTAQGHVVVLLDASASMQATDVSPSRFEVARRKAGRLIDGLGPNDTMALIAVARHPHVLSSSTHDRSVLRQALATAQPTHAEADWEAAFILAASSAQQERTTTVILSDGGLSPSLPDLPGEVRYVPIGITADNRAIDAMSIRDTPEGPQAFLRLSNTGTQAATPLVEIYVDAALFAARSLVLAAGAQDTLLLQDLPLDTQRIEARLAAPDALQLDNTAWAVRSQATQSQVLIATEGNLFLERAIGLIPHLETTVVHADGPHLPAGALAQAGPMPALIVLDGVLPGSDKDDLPAGSSLFFIDPPASTDLFAVCGALTRTAVSHVETGDPLLRHVDLASLQIAGARCIETPSWARILVAAGGHPLLAAGEIAGRRVAILAFDLHRSNLPLQVAFPILIANLANWLAPTSAVDMSSSGEGMFSLNEDFSATASLRPGTPVTLRPQVGATAIVVHMPSGRQWRVEVQDSASIPFTDTDEPGLYTIEQQVGTETVRSQFAVNLFSALESDIEPRDSIAVGTAQVRQEADLTGRREWWRWPALAALALLVVEWLAYWRVRVPRRSVNYGR